MATNNEVRTPTTGTPIVCTMPRGEVPDQLHQWTDLQRWAIDVVPIESGVRMTLPASLVQQVRDLAEREAACCAFLNLEVAVEGETMVFEVTAPNPDALPVIAALAGIPLS